MTEKQGGSDLRSNTTAAVAVTGGPVAGGPTYRLTGHKWFCSAPMSDVFLVLAQAPASAPSRTWSPPPGSTAYWARQRPCGRLSSARSITRGIVTHSAVRWSTSH
jgi:alkylation response protein AidB-like acyl-CoA dehydrogenase